MASVTLTNDNEGHPDLPPQDFGDDFEFESDPSALQSILNERGLTPGSLRPKVDLSNRPVTSTLTPAAHLPARYRKVQDKFDFFEGRNGMIFFRPSAKFSATKQPANESEFHDFESETASRFPVCSANFKKCSFIFPAKSGQKRPRAMSRGVMLDIKPRRIKGHGMTREPSPSSGKRSTQPANSDPFLAPRPRAPLTEKKLVPYVEAPHRQSISERKPIPGKFT